MSYFKKKFYNFIVKIVSMVELHSSNQIHQALIVNQYTLMKKLMSPDEMPSLKDVGFRQHSQFEEDGMLLYIFSVIGASNKRAIELCAGSGETCMAANLIINHGWEALLFDGDKDNVNRGIEFFSKHKQTSLHPPILKRAWLTTENIDQLIKENGFQGEVDLLSLDIDGNDYHIMEAITVVKPKVIICETQNIVPSHLALTIPYKPDFNRYDGPSRDFFGVSLLGMTKLLGKKGYRLIGASRHGFNAIFILKEIGEAYFPEVTVDSVHDNPYTKSRIQTSWGKVKDLPWVKV